MFSSIKLHNSKTLNRNELNNTLLKYGIVKYQWLDINPGGLYHVNYGAKVELISDTNLEDLKHKLPLKLTLKYLIFNLFTKRTKK